MRYTERERLKITSESKLLITLGDSFIEGQGALPDDIWEKYEWDKHKLLEDYGPNFEQYYDLEINNSFPSFIVKEHLKDYTSINLGFRGRGLRCATKNLTSLNLDLELYKAKEIIVVVAATQFSRFDLLRGHNYDSHFNFLTIWPHKPDINAQSPGEARLWEGYATEIHNDTTEIIEFLMNVQEIKTWCKLYKARLILTSACEPRFKQDYIEHILTDRPGEYKNLNPLKKVIDWEKEVWYPGGYNSFTDLLSFYEGKPNFIGTEDWFPWSEKESRYGKGFFTPCAHPTIKANKVLAEHFYKENF